MRNEGETPPLLLLRLQCAEAAIKRIVDIWLPGMSGEITCVSDLFETGGSGYEQLKKMCKDFAECAQVIRWNGAACDAFWNQCQSVPMEAYCRAKYFDGSRGRILVPVSDGIKYLRIAMKFVQYDIVRLRKFAGHLRSLCGWLEDNHFANFTFWCGRKRKNGELDCDRLFAHLCKVRDILCAVEVLYSFELWESVEVVDQLRAHQQVAGQVHLRLRKLKHFPFGCVEPGSTDLQWVAPL
eukprot:3141402-Rhodomonas_salina.1